MHIRIYIYIYIYDICNTLQVELDVIVGASLASRIPVIKTLASWGNRLQYGTKPIWQLQVCGILCTYV